MHHPRLTLAMPCLVLLSVLLSALLLPDAGEAVLIDVPGDQPSISAALAVAGGGDTVRVAPGVYSSAATGETFPFTITEAVTLLGDGYATTTIDADQDSSLIHYAAPPGGGVIGFTLTGGRALRGGAIYVDGGTPEIAHNLVIANGALNSGSAIHITSAAAPWIHHNVFWENYDLDLEDPGDPHAVQFVNGDGRFEHNLVGRTDSNGLFTLLDSNPTIRNNIFYENGIPPDVRGRGICHFGGPETVISHNLFHGNVIAALLIDGTGDTTAAGANAIALDDSIYGNLDGDPLFIDPDGGDWHLQEGSPAIDAGDPLSAPDPDGTIADIGPFYFDQGSVGIAGEASPPGATAALLPLAPNPFLGTTTIRYVQQQDGDVELAIHTITGRHVVTLVEARRTAGQQTAVWDGRDARGRPVASGVYLVRLQVEGSRPLARRVILVR
ncbi:MAG: right-handed parallel beta-helix repeat-containing protein [Candidatus Eiseniibacteriota bacterium]|jgi:hypothetical protein